MRTLLTSLLLTCGVLLANPARATAQAPEAIQIDGTVEELHSEPLEDYLRIRAHRDRFRPYFGEGYCTGVWRGYHGTWVIDEGKLFLIKLVGDPCSRKPRDVPLHVLFPSAGARVPATWYSGTLVVPRGEAVEPGLPYPRYERYLWIEISNGIVTGQRE